jgi:hypothetical protein
MPDTPEGVTDPALRTRLNEVRKRLRNGLAGVDANRRLVGRPMATRVIAGQTFEVVFKEVPSIDEATVLGVKRLIGTECFCTVTPQTAETLAVRFVVPLRGT